MELQEKVQKVRNLVDDDETLKSWIKRANQGWITGWELVALAHQFIYDPDNNDQSSEEIVEDWSKIIDWGLDNKKIIPYSKHSFRPLGLKELENLKGDGWLIAVNDAEHLVELMKLEPFFAATIDFLFKEIYPEETKKQTPAKESTRKIENLCRAIACLAIDAYGYNPNDSKSPIPRELSEMMNAQFNFDISERTIREWIKEGTKIIETNKRKT